MDFWDYYCFFGGGEDLGFFWILEIIGYLGFFGIFSKLLRFLLKVTEVTTQVNRVPILVGGKSVINGAYPV